jgi:DNA-binding MurR/RpiR family transcriptional regulator
VGELVREGMEHLTPSEKRVARALLAAYPVAGLESLKQLAGRANVTAPTVLRFVRKLGFDGYPGFQKVLREEVHARMTSPLSLYRTQVPSPKEKVLDASLLAFRRAIDKTFRSLPASEFRAVVRLLADQRRRIVLTGGRFSQLAAHYLYAQLRMVRPDCVLVGETFDPRTDSLVDVGRNDVVCLFDYRRYQDDTVEFGRGAAARGATVILFTDPWLSPLAEVANHVLTSYPDAPSPFDSMLGGFALTEAVLAGVVAQLGEEGRQRVELFETARGSSEDPVPETTNGGRRKRGRRS